MSTQNQNTYRIVLQLVRAALFDDASFVMFDEVKNWQAVYQELADQTMLSVCAEAMNRLTPSMPAELRRKCLIQNAANVHLFHKNLSLQDAATRELRRQGIPVAVLKGAIAAANYPVPEHRLLGDIDLLVREEDYERARDCLLGLGYRLKRGCDGELVEELHQKHLVLQKDGIFLELHISAFWVPDEGVERELHACMTEGMRKIEELMVAGHNVPGLPVLQNALEFLVHVQSHICDKGVGLRQVADWMLFVNRYLSDAVYERELRPILQRTGLETFARILTRTCQLYLGLPEDGLQWCKGVEDTVCEDLMEYILQQGNFGQKNVQNSGGRALARLHHPAEFFRQLQSGGLTRFPRFRECRVLRPLAWVPQLGRYLQYVFSRNLNLSTEARDARRRAALFEELELFENHKLE